jgi:putative DNA primase/helicase
MPTPIFDQFMLDIMGWNLPPTVCQCAACLISVGKPDEERLELHQAEVRALVAYQMRVYGYALTGDVTEQALFLQIGEGGNGKGVLNDLISRDIMGRVPDGYSCVIPIEALLAPKGERHPTELTGLWHARLALARESDEGVRWNEGRIKSLTGGDPVQARKMRQDYNEFEPTHKLLAFGNSTPTMRSADQHAMKRRVQMTNFPQKWDDEADEANHVLKADKLLSERLRAEAPGILAKLIEGCLDWQKRKSLEPPQTVREASRKYLAQQNVILRWLDERCDRTDPATGTKTNHLWKDYCKWAEANKEWTCKRNQFNERLERAGIKITRTATEKGRCEGIMLLAQESAANRD